MFVFLRFEMITECFVLSKNIVLCSLVLLRINLKKKTEVVVFNMQVYTNEMFLNRTYYLYSCIYDQLKASDIYQT